MTDTDATGTHDFQQVFSDDDPLDVLWVKAYQGEVLGEALFGRMADHVADHEDGEDHAAKMRVLQDLERRTKEAIAPALGRAGLSTDPDPESLETAEALAEAAKIPWKDLMATFEPITSQFCALYRRIGELDPSEQDASDLLVAHEQALCAFARAEIAGNTETSLDQIKALAHMQ